MDVNAWDLVEEGGEVLNTEETEEEADEADTTLFHGSHKLSFASANNDLNEDDEKKRVSSTLSSSGRSVDAGGDIITRLQTTRHDGGAAEDAEKRAKRQSKSKSPAIESLRRVRRTILENVCVLPRRRFSSGENVLTRTRFELADAPLEDWCLRPRASRSERLSKSSGRVHGSHDDPTPSSSSQHHNKMLSPSLLFKQGQYLQKKEKCSYLFANADETPLTTDLVDGARALERVHAYDPFCPVHGSRRRVRRKRLMDMHSFVNSVDTLEDPEQLSSILQSQGFLAKKIRKQRRAFLTGQVEGINVERAKRDILRNITVISAAFLLLFTGFNGLQNLQTSVNGEMGADALCVLYVSLALSSLFVPSFVLGRLGCKRTLMTAIGTHILYFCANFIPRYYSLVPASILAGVSASCLWAAKCVYITESAIKYAKLNVEAQNIVIVRFFGSFFMVYHLGQVLGNLISSLILSTAIERHEPEDRVDASCGSGFVSHNLSALSDRAQLNLQRPPRLAFLAVVGVDLCCAILALLVVYFFLNALDTDEETINEPSPKFSADVLRVTLKNLRRPKPVLLIPITIFNGMEQALAVGLFTKAYVGCGLGIWQIGYVMTSFGVADAVCSLVFGPLIKLFGRMPLFMFGWVINLLMLLTLWIWPLNPGDRALFNAIAGVWGMADGVWNTQLNGFWVALLGRDSLEVAFANYRFWLSFGLAMGFLLIRITSVDAFLLSSFILLLVGIIGYFIVELFDLFLDFLKRTMSAEPPEGHVEEIEHIT